MKKLLILLPALLCAQVHDSVIPHAEQLHRGETLQSERYSQEQWEEMRRSMGQRDEALRVMSFNMLFNIKDAALPLEHRWPARKRRIIEYVESAKPDIILAQEIYRDQLISLLKVLGFEYAFYGRGQMDGKDVGEMNGIFYLKSRLQPLEKEVLYMSTESDRVSTEPLAQNDRTLTMLILKDRRTGKDLAVFNSHFDFRSIDSRTSHAHFVAEYVEPLAQKLPVIFGGDLNLFPHRPGLTHLPAYDGDYVDRILTKGSLSDTRQRAILGQLGPISTFTNLSDEEISPFQGTGTPGVILDRLYMNDKGTVVISGVDPARVDGEFPSDHMPIFIDIILD